MINSFWILRCVLQLRRYRPAIGIADAESIARSAFARTTGMLPEDAARFFAGDSTANIQAPIPLGTRIAEAANEQGCMVPRVCGSVDGF